jgi:ATP-dependent RNA helicase RhlE
VLVFSRTKHGANKISKQLEDAGITSAAIHGNKSQNARTKALADFKNNGVRVLVATDIAARGIDIDQLPQVVNYDLPNVPEDYVHRIGRTGRAGASGQAVSLVSADEIKQLQDIERLTQQLITREVVAGFEASNPLPETKLNTRPFKPHKPKSPKPEHRDGNRGAGSAKKTSNNSERRPSRDGERTARPAGNPNNPNRSGGAGRPAQNKPGGGPRRASKPSNPR